VEIHTVLDSFTLFIPVAFSRNPVTGTNFQGKGVQPDIKVSGETAIPQVQLHALEKQIERASDPERKAELGHICREIRSSLGAAPDRGPEPPRK
jgi:C-terminal processing protease CtpA/Prc